MLDTLLNYVLVGLLLLVPIALLAGATYVLIRPLEDLDDQQGDGASIDRASEGGADATVPHRRDPLKDAPTSRRPA